MSHYTDHGWRPDEFTIVRGDWMASVSRAWCADDGKENGWRWLAWRLADGSILDHEIPDGVQRHDMTCDAARAAAEAYIAEQLANATNLNVYAFAGAEATS